MAHQKCQEFLQTELQQLGAQVTAQKFSKFIPALQKHFTLTNIIASFELEKRNRILLCAHWDSRPWGDMDSMDKNRTRPIPGANDGASGVAVLLGVARCLQQLSPAFGVDIIFFDGEDLGIPGQEQSYALGSQYFAENKDARYRPQFGILLDMVGDRDLQIYQEQNSLEYAPEIVHLVWQKAGELGMSAFIPAAGYQVTDDHLPLLKSGIRCIDLIDFDYDYWHTSEDTPDKCSPESLGQVGRVLLGILYQPT